MTNKLQFAKSTNVQNARCLGHLLFICFFVRQPDGCNFLKSLFSFRLHAGDLRQDGQGSDYRGR